MKCTIILWRCKYVVFVQTASISLNKIHLQWVKHVYKQCNESLWTDLCADRSAFLEMSATRTSLEQYAVNCLIMVWTCWPSSLVGTRIRALKSCSRTFWRAPNRKEVVRRTKRMLRVCSLYEIIPKHATTCDVFLLHGNKKQEKIITKIWEKYHHVQVLIRQDGLLEQTHVQIGGPLSVISPLFLTCLEARMRCMTGIA